MSIKTLFVFLAEKITGRKCSRCLHNHRCRCCHPNGDMFLRCWHSITRPGFEKRRPRYLKPEDVRLSHEERHQLEKIKGVLHEASETAKGSGLVGTSAKPPLCIERDKEDYFRCECRCPECATFLGAYTYGRAWTNNGLPEEYRTNCHNCGQAIDWSGVPYPDKKMEG